MSVEGDDIVQNTACAAEMSVTNQLDYTAEQCSFVVEKVFRIWLFEFVSKMGQLQLHSMTLCSTFATVRFRFVSQWIYNIKLYSF